MGAARHAIEPHTEPVLKFAERFARRLAAVLEDGRTHQKYEQIMLIAPPRFIGHMRECLPENVKRCVVREVGKDMTSANTASIRKLVTEPFQGTD